MATLTFTPPGASLGTSQAGTFNSLYKMAMPSSGLLGARPSLHPTLPFVLFDSGYQAGTLDETGFFHSTADIFIGDFPTSSFPGGQNTPRQITTCAANSAVAAISTSPFAAGAVSGDGNACGNACWDHTGTWVFFLREDPKGFYHSLGIHCDFGIPFYTNIWAAEINQSTGAPTGRYTQITFFESLATITDPLGDSRAVLAPNVSSDGKKLCFTRCYTSIDPLTSGWADWAPMWGTLAYTNTPGVPATHNIPYLVPGTTQYILKPRVTSGTDIYSGGVTGFYNYLLCNGVVGTTGAYYMAAAHNPHGYATGMDQVLVNCQTGAILPLTSDTYWTEDGCLTPDGWLSFMEHRFQVFDTGGAMPHTNGYNTGSNNFTERIRRDLYRVKLALDGTQTSLPTTTRATYFNDSTAPEYIRAMLFGLSQTSAARIDIGLGYHHRVGNRLVFHLVIDTGEAPRTASPWNSGTIYAKSAAAAPVTVTFGGAYFTSKAGSNLGNTPPTPADDNSAGASNSSWQQDPRRNHHYFICAADLVGSAWT